MIEILSATNPRRIGRGILLDVDIDGRGLVEFLAVEDDLEAHGRDLYTRAVAGEFGEIAEEQATGGVPVSVSMRQARLALLAAGLLPQVEAAIAALEGDDGERVRIEWEYAQSVDRDWPALGTVTSALGLSPAQVDELFVAAAQM